MAVGTVTVFASGTAADGALDGWTNLTNVYSDDGSPATRTGTSKNTWYGNLLSFNLSGIPTDATIATVTMSAEWANSANDTSGPVLMLAAQTNGTLYDAGATDDSGQTSYEVFNYTPTGLTASQLRGTGANGFWGVLRFRRTDNTAHTGSVDYLKIQVIYTTVTEWAVTAAEGLQTQTSDVGSVSFSESAALYTPICGILDNFNRADAPNLGTAWGGAFGADCGAWQIVSNQAVPA